MILDIQLSDTEIKILRTLLIFVVAFCVGKLCGMYERYEQQRSEEHDG
jgi:hypothetical protein